MGSRHICVGPTACLGRIDLIRIFLRLAATSIVCSPRSLVSMTDVRVETWEELGPELSQAELDDLVRLALADQGVRQLLGGRYVFTHASRFEFY